MPVGFGGEGGREGRMWSHQVHAACSPASSTSHRDADVSPRNRPCCSLGSCWKSGGGSPALSYLAGAGNAKPPSSAPGILAFRWVTPQASSSLTC